jgi:hypothetical protein
MPLPKIITPEYITVLPLSKKEVRYRPFLVKEQKVLITAIEGYNKANDNDVKHLIDATFQILENCVLTKGIDVRDMAAADAEWLFLQIRMKSVSEKVELVITHSCNEQNDVVVDLKSTKMTQSPDHTRKVMITDDVGVIMKYPSLKDTLATEAAGGNVAEQLFDGLIDSIDQVFDADNVEDVSNVPRDEMRAWLENLNEEQNNKILRFFTDLPYLSTQVKYKCKCGEVDTFEVKGTASFFT